MVYTTSYWQTNPTKIAWQSVLSTVTQKDQYEMVLSVQIEQQKYETMY